MTEVDTTICGDCLDVMRGMPDGSVNCCVTSPPYWGLRDYGVDGQLGLEKTPEEYVAKMVEVFGEVWRVLRDDGTLWLNLGDTYASAWVCNRRSIVGNVSLADGKRSARPNRVAGVLKEKDMCGIPWRVAFALQAAGWYLRQDIIWHKPNPMPESVRDRCTKAHEYIFLMSKKPRYYYDAEAIKEDCTKTGTEKHLRGGNGKRAGTREGLRGKVVGRKRDYEQEGRQIGHHGEAYPTNGRNKRSVWTVTTKPYSEAHFATFPPDLILPCILAGCPSQVCKKCGEPRLRIVEKKPSTMNIRIRDAKKGILDKKSGGKATAAEVENYGKEEMGESTTTGYTDCGCNAGFDGGIVLDPFMGSGTVGLVAYQNNRHYIGIELNPEYCKLRRIDDEKDKFALIES